MASNIEENVIQRLRALSADQQREVLEFAENLAKEAQPSQVTIWEMIRDIVEEVPPEAWEEVPTDGSLNVDHYLYGAPKK